MRIMETPYKFLSRTLTDNQRMCSYASIVKKGYKQRHYLAEAIDRCTTDFYVMVYKKEFRYIRYEIIVDE